MFLRLLLLRNNLHIYILRNIYQSYAMCFIFMLFVSVVSNSCEDGRVYLENSTSGDESGPKLVEMCSEGVWSPVCDYNWTVADATVVCRELGYKDSGNM